MFTPELMLCAGEAWVGPLPLRWWAVALPDGTLRERSTNRRGGIDLGDGRVRVRAPDLRLELELGAGGEPVETASPAGEAYVWTVDGDPHEVGPVAFAPDLSAVAGLRFGEWSAREDHTNLLLLRSHYRQPFGSFAGGLPGGLRLAEGYGVMEAHDVRW